MKKRKEEGEEEEDDNKGSWQLHGLRHFWMQHSKVKNLRKTAGKSSVCHYVYFPVLSVHTI